MLTSAVILKPGRDKSVRHRHPWIFSGAVQRLQGNPQPGEVVDIFDQGGEWLGRGGYSPKSQIVVRIWTWDRDCEIGIEFFRRAIQEAVAFREPLGPYTDSCRLVNAENDRLPGLIVDRYTDVLVVQFLTVAAEYFRAQIIQVLSEMPSIACIYERSDADVRAKEGLNPQNQLISGELPNLPLSLRENGWRFLCDPVEGHKTGFYLDQRNTRSRIRRLVSDYLSGGTVLNVFSYTGPFAIAALSGGAGRVVNLDSSGPALALARANYQTNNFTPTEDSFLEGNAFELLRQLYRRGSVFDMVILDPPKLAHTKADEPRATRGYKDLNLSALRLIRPNGLLVTFSCSGLISEDLFQKIVFGAAVDARRDVQIMERCGQPLDHPTLLTFPEGTYLKGLICRVL